MKPEALFHIQREAAIAGPYDLVQMSHLLRTKIITGETMTRFEGEENWKPFSWHPQFSIVLEIPADATSPRVEEMKEKAAAARAYPILLPSRETVIKVAALLVGMVVAGTGSFLLGLLSMTLGWILLAGGMGAGGVAYCLIIARMLDEDGGTMFKVMFIPYYDSYYFLANLWKYFDLLCVKSIGGAVVMGAVIALLMDGRQFPH